VSIVDCGSEGCYPLPQLLSSMTGVLAVGLAGGQIMLMDLCRINCDEGRSVMHQGTGGIVCAVFRFLCHLRAQSNSTVLHKSKHSVHCVEVYNYLYVGDVLHKN
jgi:hypothetical protein